MNFPVMKGMTRFRVGCVPSPLIRGYKLYKDQYIRLYVHLGKVTPRFKVSWWHCTTCSLTMVYVPNNWVLGFWLIVIVAQLWGRHSKFRV